MTLNEYRGAVVRAAAIVKRGPRGGAIRSGRCRVCDDPEIGTAKDVRRFAKALGYCSRCGDRGLDLVRFAERDLHVRCVVRMYGLVVLASGSGLWARARLCCLGAQRMKELIRLKQGAK